jgi:hypothetical protein
MTMPDSTHDDERDERLAGLLAVEPLDDVTRRRLVRTALDAGRSHRRAWQAAAAAAAAVVVGGGAWLVATSGGPGSHRTVAAPTAPSVVARPEAPSAGAQVVPSAPVFLGDFGNLNDPTAVARLRAAAASPPASSTGQPLGAPALPAERCDPGAGTVRAVAAGTLDGRPVVVLVVGDHLTAVATGPCEVRPLG